MADISPFTEPQAHPEHTTDVESLRSRVVAAIKEVHLAVCRWRNALTNEERHRLFVVNCEIPDSDYPRLIVERSGVSLSSCDRHEFDSFEDLAGFLVNEKTMRRF